MRRYLPHPRITKDAYGHTLIDGYTYMGRQAIPPLPNRIAMTDRITGDERVLSHTGSVGTLTLDLVAVNPAWLNVTTYGPHEGPYTGNWRLYLENGTLVAEATILPHGNQRVLTRLANQRTMLDITVDVDGNIVYTELTV